MKLILNCRLKKVKKKGEVYISHSFLTDMPTAVDSAEASNIHTMARGAALKARSAITESKIPPQQVTANAIQPQRQKW